MNEQRAQAGQHLSGSCRQASIGLYNSWEDRSKAQKRVAAARPTCGAEGRPILLPPLLLSRAAWPAGWERVHAVRGPLCKHTAARFSPTMLPRLLQKLRPLCALPLLQDMDRPWRENAAVMAVSADANGSAMRAGEAGKVTKRTTT